MPNSLQSSAIASPASRRATNCSLSSITEHSFQGIITPSPEGESVTYVSGTMCYLCLRPLTLKQLRFFLRCISTFIELGNIWEQLFFEQVDRIPLGTPAGVRVDFQRRCHVRVAELRLCDLQRRTLRMKQRSVRVTKRMPIDPRQSSSPACGTQ